MRTEIEAAIDFPDEVDAEAAVAAFTGLCGQALTQVDGLLEGCEAGAAVREGVSVALVGKPNVGKSSLMNALLRRDRSIVTTMPGTTRDAIEESLHVDGVPVRLIDTAGWRIAEDRAEQAGVERAKSAAEGATLVLMVVDGSAPPGLEDATIGGALDPRRTIVVANKEDLGRGADEDDLADLLAAARTSGSDNETSQPQSRPLAGPRVVWVSALSGTGLRELRAALVEASLGATHADAVRVSNVRHADALRRVRNSLSRAHELAEAGRPHELTASELAAATAALGEITGETTAEDVLRHIFDRFCIGK